MPLLLPSLFLACSIRAPRNDTVRLDAGMTIRSTGASAAYYQHNLHQVNAEVGHLQVDADIIPITQLPSGPQYCEWPGLMMQKQVEQQASRCRRCDAPPDGTVAHVRHSFTSQALLWSLQHARIKLPARVNSQCDLVASLPHRHVLCARCGFNFLDQLFLSERLGESQQCQWSHCETNCDVDTNL